MIEVLDVLGQPQKMVITDHNLRPQISEEETPFHDNFLHLADLAPHKSSFPYSHPLLNKFH